ncbi:hypothetical protein H1R20_g1909, partial [Candolleomyces eurysporus]
MPKESPVNAKPHRNNTVTEPRETRRRLLNLNHPVPEVAKAKKPVHSDQIENLTPSGSGEKSGAETAAKQRERRRLNRETIREGLAREGAANVIERSRIRPDNAEVKPAEAEAATPSLPSDSSQPVGSPSIMEEYERLSRKVTKLKKKVRKLSRELVICQVELEGTKEQNVVLTNQLSAAEDRVLFEFQKGAKYAEALTLERGQVEALQEALEAAGGELTTGFGQRRDLIVL